jgi:hypothetical protein
MAVIGGTVSGKACFTTGGSRKALNPEPSPEFEYRVLYISLSLYSDLWQRLSSSALRMPLRSCPGDQRGSCLSANTTVLTIHFPLVTNTTGFTPISSQFSPGPPRSTTRNVDLRSSAINE